MKPARTFAALAGVAAVGLLAACGSAATGATSAATVNTPPPTTVAALSAWYAGVQTDYNAVVADLTAIGKDSTGSETVLGAACTKLTQDAHTLQADPAPPTSAVNTPYQAALTDVARAGEECASGVAEQDPSQMNAASADITTGTSEIDQVQAAVTAAS